MGSVDDQKSTDEVLPLTILMAVPQYPYPIVGGLERQAHELAVELSAQGHKVYAISGKSAPNQPDVENVEGIEVHRVPWSRHRFVRWIAVPLRLWRRSQQLARDVDVIHAHVFSGFGLFLILFGRVYRKPVLVKLPNVGLDGLPGLARGWLGALKIRVFLLADAVVAMSRESIDELDAIGFERTRVLVTPNGIRLRDDAGGRKRGNNSKCKFVYAGRLHEQKGIWDLLAAVKHLTADPRVGAFSVDLLGDGPLRAAVERAIAIPQLEGLVRVLGHEEDVRSVLPDYDAFVLPSYREGNSNAILEAMTAGLPVISTRVGGTEMLVGKSGEMLLHSPGDVSALAGLMKRLIGDAPLRARVGEAMRARVEEHFDIRNVARTYALAYRFLASGHRTDVGSLSNSVVLERT